MKKLDRLIQKAKPKKTILERLAEDNPYMGKDRNSLIAMLGKKGDSPKVGTWEWQKFIYALLGSKNGE